MRPAFAAMNRIVAASRPTYSWAGAWSGPRSIASTTPRIGSSAKPPSSELRPSSVSYSPVSGLRSTGRALSATAGRVK
jgi:hypothetical protein